MPAHTGKETIEFIRGLKQNPEAVAMSREFIQSITRKKEKQLEINQIIRRILK